MVADFKLFVTLWGDGFNEVEMGEGAWCMSRAIDRGGHIGNLQNMLVLIKGVSLCGVMHDKALNALFMM